MMLSKLGDYIEQEVIKNSENLFVASDVRGISTQKKFIPTKADAENIKLTNFNIVKSGRFAFNPNTARMGNKICIAFNDKEESVIVSAIYPVFKVKDVTKLRPKFLMIFFNRPEFDRYVRFHSWGSAREVFSYDDFCNIRLAIPSIEIQDSYISIYDGLMQNKTSYEDSLNDLKLVCDAYIENLKKTEELKPIGDYLKLIDVRNKDNKIKNVKSVSITKYFNEVGAKVDKNKLSNYKIVEPDQISYVQTTNNEKCFAFAINDSSENIVVTSVNNVIETDKRLNPYYLGLWFRRKEFDRFARFSSWGSARETISFDDLCKVRIPIPSVNVQERIVEIFKQLSERRKFIDELNDKIQNICPILIRGSVLEAGGQ